MDGEGNQWMDKNGWINKETKQTGFFTRKNHKPVSTSSCADRDDVHLSVE